MDDASVLEPQSNRAPEALFYKPTDIFNQSCMWAVHLVPRNLEDAMNSSRSPGAIITLRPSRIDGMIALRSHSLTVQGLKESASAASLMLMARVEGIWLPPPKI